MSLVQLAALRRFESAVSRSVDILGWLVSWLCLLMMLITCLVVFLRYVLDVGSIALQESVTYLHGTFFMLGTVVALKRGAHVRVDIFYRRMRPARQALVDLGGGLFFLLPFCAFMLIWCWDYVAVAWHIREASADADGLPAVFALKTLIPITAVVLFLQGLAEIARSVLQLLGVQADSPAASKPAHQLV